MQDAFPILIKKERLNLNYMMVRNGHAIDYKRYSKGEYSQAENIAKKKKNELEFGAVNLRDLKIGERKYK